MHGTDHKPATPQEPTQAGLAVRACLPGSPAAEAGLRWGDIILSVNGQRVLTIADFALARENCDNFLDVEYLRAGEVHNSRLWLPKAFTAHTSSGAFYTRGAPRNAAKGWTAN